MKHFMTCTLVLSLIAGVMATEANAGKRPDNVVAFVAKSGGEFDNIDDVISPEEKSEFMAGYKQAAGFAIEKLNAAPPTIPVGAKIGG